MQHAWTWLWSIDVIWNGGRGDRSRHIWFYRHGRRLSTRRRNASYRVWPESAGGHRCDEGALSAAAVDPFSQGQSLHSAKAVARQEALFRYASLGDLGAVLRELS